MKPRDLALAVVISALWSPGSMWAQGLDGEPPLPMPQTSVNRPSGLDFPPNAAGAALSRRPDTGLPNRRIPSPVPPDPNEGRPVTPDIWRKGASSHVPVHPAKTPKDEVSSEAVGSVGGSDIKEPIQRLSGPE